MRSLRADLCLGADTEARLIHVGVDGAELRVTRGHALASLEPLPKGVRFALSSSHGSVEAVGTVFSLEVDDEGHSISRLFEGRVRVRARRSDAHTMEQTLDAGRALELGVEVPRNLTSEEIAAAERLLQRPLDVPMLPIEAAGKPVTKGHRSGSLRDHEELFRTARLHRAEGRPQESARAYRELVRRFKGSEEARAALVSLGQLELGPLSQPNAALRSFDAYLARPGGSLRPEAILGRIQALEALGRGEDERRAIESFLAAYPRSPHRQRLERRRSAIR